MLRFRWGFGVAVALAACGSDPPPVDPTPTAAQVRDFWGLNPGSCWVYRYRPSGQVTDIFASVSISGPDTVRISGKTVYVLTYQPAASQASEYVLDVDSTPGEIRLARTSEGSGAMRVTTTYLAEPRPLWAAFDLDAASSTLKLNDSRFTTSATPEGGGAAIDHQWVVLNEMDTAAVAGGMAQTAIKLSYTRSDAATSNWWLVPGYGMARFTDNASLDHQVCASRVCDAANNCTGAPSCTNLVCPP
jgi:hypothetical protein